MTTGIELKKALGLSKIRYVKISRALISARKILFVWYDSYRSMSPITNHRIKRFPWVSTIVHGTDLAHGSNKKTVFTPPVSIEDFNGAIKGTLIVPVNLAGDNFIDSKQFSKKFEGFVGKGLDSLKEFVTIADLMDTGNISNRTMHFRRRRTQLMGGENTQAKLIDCYVDEAEGSITFAFLTEVTPDVELYGDDYEYQEVNPDTFALSRNRSEVYEIQIKILEFFKWLDTHPEKQEILRADIKEILDVSYIQVFSTSPSFEYQGFNYSLSQIDGSIHPEQRKPQRWNHVHGDGEAFLDKHLYGLIRQMKFFLNPMSSMLSKKLRDRGFLVQER